MTDPTADGDPPIGEKPRGPAADDAGAAAADGDEPASARDVYREQFIRSIGGWVGVVITAIPPIVFVIVNAAAGLKAAIIAAISTAVALAAYRLIRRQSLQQAANGLVAVIVAAVIAARTGQARGYFLLGIWASWLYAGAFFVSVLARRPVVGLLWEFVDPTPDVEQWRRCRPLLRAYDAATLGAVVIFLARGIVQQTLFHDHRTGWLAFARIAMGYPLTILAIGFGFLVVTRARKRIAPTTEQTAAE